MKILGLSFFYHDAAACLLVDGVPVAMSEEERFSRKKHDAGYPELAIAFVLRQSGLTAKDLDAVVFYEKPFWKFDRLIKSALATFPLAPAAFSESLKSLFTSKIWIRNLISSKLDVPPEKVHFSGHHLSHMASSFFCSPWEKAAILTVDGVGEWATTALGVGEGNTIRVLHEIRYPHSIGLLYSAFTAFLGFEVNDGEYKVMGMAPYGAPRYADRVRKLVTVYPDGSYALNLEYFSFQRSISRTYSEKFVELFGEPRDPKSHFFTRTTGWPVYFGEKPTGEAFDKLAERQEYYADIAASVQAVTEELLINLANALYAETGIDKLCFAGGVALNSVANWKLIQGTPFTEMFIQPAAGDAGGALGAALAYEFLGTDKKRPFIPPHAFYGASYTTDDITKALDAKGVRYEVVPNDADVIERTAQALVDGKVIGWYRGRFEWGPRALGSRSILADPRRADMKDIVNTKIKFREPYRPFAPSVLEEKAGEWFDLPNAEHHYPARFMLYVVQVNADKRERIPAITHVDGSARPQLVVREDAPDYYRLIERFYEKTGVPLVLDTSFNLKGEPIVNTPENALNTYAKSGMDMLVMENVIVRREDLPDAVSVQTATAILPSERVFSFGKLAAKLAGSLRRQWFPIVLAMLVGALCVAPAVLARVSLGSDYRGIPFLYLDNEDLYFSRIQEIIDGHWPVGSAFLYEYKDQYSPQPPVAELVFYAFPTTLLRIPLKDFLVVVKFLYPAALFLLAYALVKKIAEEIPIEDSRIAAAAGGLLVTLGYEFLSFGTIVNAFRGVALPLTLSVWTRPVNPITGALFLFAFLNLLWISYRKPAAWKALVLGALWGLMIGYAFSWAIALAVLVFLGAGLAARREWRGVRAVAAVFVVGMLASAPYWYALMTTAPLEGSEKFALRAGLLNMHAPILNKTLIAAILVYAVLTAGILWKRGWRAIRGIPEWWWFCATLLVAGMSAYLQQVVTGRTIWPYHFVQYTKPFASVCVIVAIAYAFRSHRRFRQIVFACIIAFCVLNGAVMAASYRSELGNFRDWQNDAPMYAWLNAHAPKDSVVLVQEEAEHRSRFIPSFTSCNVYTTSYFMTDVPAERIDHNFFVWLRINHVTPDTVRPWLDRHEGDVRDYYYDSFFTLFAQRKDAWLAQTEDRIVAGYDAFYREDFAAELRKYRIDYFLADHDLSKEERTSYGAGDLVFSEGGLRLYAMPPGAMTSPAGLRASASR